MNHLFGDNDETPQTLPNDNEDDFGDPTTEPDETPSAPPTAEPPNPPTPPPAPHIPVNFATFKATSLHLFLAPGIAKQGGREYT